MRHCESFGKTKDHGAVVSIVRSCLAVEVYIMRWRIALIGRAINYKSLRNRAICESIAGFASVKSS